MTSPKAFKFIAVFFFAAETLLFLRWIPDDSFISFRYAENFAAGNGLVFNVGERVEGYSNLLWTLLLGFAAKAGAGTVKTALFVSLVCSLASVWFGVKLFETVLRWGDTAERRYSGVKTALGLGLIVSLPMIFYATSGLETHAALLALLLGVFFHLEAVHRGHTRLHIPSSFFFLLLALLRPEGIAFLVVNTLFLLGKRRSLRGTAGIVCVTAPLALYAAVAALRFAYYDAILPNTYLAKPGVSWSYLEPAMRGINYLGRFFVISGLILMVPFCVPAFADKKRRYACAYLTIFVALQLLFIIFVGGDVLRFDRFTVPVLPLTLAVALVGIIRLDSFAWVSGSKIFTKAAWVCVVIIVLLNAGRIHRALKKNCIHDWMHARAHSQIGFVLRDLLPADASVVVNEVGAISYYSGLTTIDMIGLTDATVGRIIYESYQRYGVSGSEWSVPRISDYLFSRNPTCVVVPSFGTMDPEAFEFHETLMHPIWNGVYAHPDLARKYRCVFAIAVHEEKFLYFFVRRDIDCDEDYLRSVPPRECMRLRVY